MDDKKPKSLNKARMKKRALGRWENEGGAIMPDNAHTTMSGIRRGMGGMMQGKGMVDMRNKDKPTDHTYNK